MSASICPECGSGLLDGDHIADYPCSLREAKAKGRCPEMHPRSTVPSQCQRPEGHSGDHVATSYSGRLKVYPAKWTT